MKELIQKERICGLFKELAEIDSISFQEREAADYVKEFLADLGIEAYEDEAWKNYYELDINEKGMEAARSLRNRDCWVEKTKLAGNVYAFVPGELPGKPLLFSAHLDTVSPGTGKKVLLEEDKKRFISAGTTILGSDDMAGVAQILEAVRLLKEHKIKHRSLELVFPVAEEVYGQGSQVFDYNKLESEESYILDLSGSVGIAANQAPSIISFQIQVEGRSAHAGFEPEKGIHAIQIASQALAGLELGRIGSDSTRNIGTISGGTAGNIIPDHVTLEGEIRSYSHEKALALLEETKQLFAETAENNGAESKFSFQVQIKAYHTAKNSAAVRKFQKACREMDIDSKVVSTFGGSDNNSFAERGIAGLVLSCGMQKVHTKEEYILLEDLYLGTELVMRLMTEL